MENNWYQYLIPAADALSDWPMIELSNEQVDALRHGMRIAAGETEIEKSLGVSEQGELVALLVLDKETMEWQPKKVLFS